MLLYTCGMQKHGANGPLVKHPCGMAAQALDRAGYRYEIKVVAGFKNVPFSRGGNKRDEIVALTGGPDVPVLVLDDGTAVSGSGEIVAWASAHPA